VVLVDGSILDDDDFNIDCSSFLNNCSSNAAFVSPTKNESSLILFRISIYLVSVI
jgi:hypothetical protein